MRVASIYLPNGNPVGTDKYPYKLAWMRRLGSRVRDLLDSEQACVLAGDYNVAPTDDDVYDPMACAKDAVVQPSARAQFHVLLNLGLVDAYRVFHAEPHQFSVLGSLRPQMDDRRGPAHRSSAAVAAGGRPARGRRHRPRARAAATMPSDHTPVWCELT